MTIESALAQNKKWTGDIAEAADANRQKINHEKHNQKRVLEDIRKIEESIQKMQQETDDLTNEINYSTKREDMFRKNHEEVKRYNETTDAKLQDTIVKNKQMEDRLREQVNEAQVLKDEYKRLCRTGRQPSLSEKKNQKKKEQKERGRKTGTHSSFTGTESDASSTIDPRNVMQVPELDDSNDLPDFGEKGVSKVLLQSDSAKEYDENGFVAKGKLSVIPSCRESSTLKSLEEEENPELTQVEQQVTLKQSKIESNSRKKKKKELKEIKAQQKKAKEGDTGGACCNGNGGCTIF